MTATVKERLRSEFNQAKVDGKQRVERIGRILKDAAELTFDELKEGSTELHVLTRKSLAELLEEVEETSDVANAETTVSKSQREGSAASEVVTPTWKELIIHAIAIVRDRKGDWFQQLKEYLNENAIKYDADMTEEYGNRYPKVKSLFKEVFSWIESKVQANSDTTDSDIQPVNIEVVDGEAANTGESVIVNSLEPNLQDKPIQ